MTTGKLPSESHEIRVISIYATHWRLRDWDGELSHLDLGRLEEFYGLFKDQLPQVISREPVSPGALALAPDGPHSEPGQVLITRAESWLFVLPSDQVVAVIDFYYASGPLGSDPGPTAEVLEHCAYAQLFVGEADLQTHIAEQATRVGAEEIDVNPLLPPERHQVVFAPYREHQPLPDEDTLKQILYRVDPPNRPEFMELRRPSGLNEAGHTLAAVTPYVSLLYGHQGYIENSVFLTAVQAVGTTARFREIWHRAHGRVRNFRDTVQSQMVGAQRRADMEELVDELGNLELDLSFSVETSSDLGLLIPSLRIESFHRDLYAAMELRERAETVSRMFSRLAASIGSELTAADIRERGASEASRLRRDAAFTILGFIAAPFTFLIAFFSINANPVNGQWSIFNWHHYLFAYIAAAIVALVPLVTFFVLNTHTLERNRADKKQRAERLEAANATESLPNLLGTDLAATPQPDSQTA